MPPYDETSLTAGALLRIASEESEGPGRLTGRMHLVITELAQNSGPDGPAKLAIALARRHLVLLDSVAHALNLPIETLLDAAEEHEHEPIHE